MTRSLRLYPAASILLILVCSGLLIAIFVQKRDISRARVEQRLRLDEPHLEALLAKARLVTPQLPALQAKSRALDAEFLPLSQHLYQVANRPAIESFFRQISEETGYSLSGIEDVTTEPTPIFNEHMLNVRLQGPMKNLPLFTERFFRQSTATRVDRISIVSPDLLFQMVRVKVTLRYFERLEDSSIILSEFDYSRLDVDLDYLSGIAADDADLGPAANRVREQAKTLKDLTAQLKTAEELEKHIAAIEKVVTGTRGVLKAMDRNRSLVQESLPTLFVRVRNSALGSAAMTLEGGDVLFPEITGND